MTYFREEDIKEGNIKTEKEIMHHRKNHSPAGFSLGSRGGLFLCPVFNVRGQ